MLRQTICALLVFAFLAGPISAQTTGSSATTTTQQNSSGQGGGGLGVAIGLGVAGLGVVSAVSSLLLTSFGGRIIAVVPCSGGMLHVTILAARVVPKPEFYIWTPFTATKMAGPPRNPGQQVLGLADIPFVCFIGGGFLSSPIPLYGKRMMTVGTSPAL